MQLTLEQFTEELILSNPEHKIGILLSYHLTNKIIEIFKSKQ